MSDTAILVEDLGKQYRIGGQRQMYSTLRETLVAAAKGIIPRRPDKSRRDMIWALRDVSFEVKHGEVVGIIGRNGAGKSTLLKLLAHITEPTEGRVSLRGRVGSLLEVGTGFHPELTGRDNVYLNGAILGMRRGEIERKFDEIVAFAEIEQFLDTPVKRYSSGMYVRLAFAIAAQLEPEILLVDEVLAVGDAQFQKKCLGKIGDVARSGRTVLFVSHSMAAVQNLCSEAVLLDAGRVVTQGTVGDVVEEYLRISSHMNTPRTADLASLPRERDRSPVFTKGLINGAPLVGQHAIVPEQGLTFDLELCLPQPEKQATIGIHFEDRSGVRVYAVNSRWEMKTIDLGPGLHRVLCTIESVPLVPGNYYISLGFSARGQQVDWLDRISCLQFEQEDIYKTGELPFPGQGYFLAKANWAISSLNNRPQAAS